MKMLLALAAILSLNCWSEEVGSGSMDLYGHEQDNTPATVGADLSNHSAEQLFTQAQEALADSKDLGQAVELFSELLLLPKNEYSQSSLELLGLAYERQGNQEQAKSKYRSFISQYPDSDAYTRVRQRLLALEIISPEVVAARQPPRNPTGGLSNQFSGSDSVYWFGSSTGVKIPGWHSDASLLIDNISLSDRAQIDQWKITSIMRYSRSENIGQVGTTRDNLSAASVDIDQQDWGTSIKLGRQSAAWGVTDRFDGLVLGYQIDPDLKINLLGGRPVTLGATASRSFYGIGLDWSVTKPWFASLYVNHETSQGRTTRSVIGLENRYYDQGLNAMSDIEYDWLYRIVTNALAQINWQTGKNNIYVLVSDRKTPMTTDQFSVISADPSRPAILTQDQLYQLIGSAASNSQTMVAGVSHDLNKSWTAGVNAQINKISIPANQLIINDIQSVTQAAMIPLTQPLGTAFTGRGLDLQIKGTGIIVPNDSIATILSWNASAGNNSWSLTQDVGRPWADSTIDLIAKVTLSHEPGQATNSVYVALRITTRLSTAWSSDAMVGLTVTSVQDSLQSLRSIQYNKTVYYGLRTDF